MGAPDYNAAREILRDWRADQDSSEQEPQARRSRKGCFAAVLYCAWVSAVAEAG